MAVTMPRPRPHSRAHVRAHATAPAQQQPGMPDLLDPGPQLRPGLQLGHYLLLFPRQLEQLRRDGREKGTAAVPAQHRGHQTSRASPADLPQGRILGCSGHPLIPAFGSHKISPVGAAQGAPEPWALLVTRPALGDRGAPGGCGGRTGLGLKSPKIHGNTFSWHRDTMPIWVPTPTHLSGPFGAHTSPASPQDVPSVPWGGHGGTKRHRGPSTCSVATGPSAGPAPGGDWEERGGHPGIRRTAGPAPGLPRSLLVPFIPGSHP